MVELTEIQVVELGVGLAACVLILDRGFNFALGVVKSRRGTPEDTKNEQRVESLAILAKIEDNTAKELDHLRALEQHAAAEAEHRRTIDTRIVTVLERLSAIEARQTAGGVG